MSNAGNIARNATIQYASRVVGTILGLATLAILTRYLGAAGYGQFTVAASYLQFVGTLVDFGLTITAIQMLSEPGADGRKILGNLVALRVVSAVVFFGLAALLALAFPWGSAVQAAIAVGSFSFIFLSVHQIFVGLFQKSLRMEFPAIAEVVGRAILLGGVALVAALGGGLVAVMAAMGAANLVMLLISRAAARRIEPYRVQFDGATARAIIRRSWPIALSIMFNLVYLRGDVIIMKIVGRPEAEIGLYGAAYKPLDVITVIPIIFMGLVLPLFVRAWSTLDREKVRRIIQRAVDAVSLLAFPTLAGGLALATPLMLFISGPEFAGSGPLLAMLVAAAFMVFYGSLFGHLIVGIGRQKTMTWFYAADAALSLALYFWAIPRWGATAAAAVTIVSEAVIAVAATAIVVRATGYRPRLAVSGKALAAAALMGAAIAALPGYNVIVRMLIGIVFYGALVIIFRAVGAEDIRELIERKA
jgi:O-antigen/teichoic acid export membrane protein